MKNIRFSIFAIFLLASCTSTPQQEADKSQLMARLSESAQSNITKTVSLLLPQCIKSLQNIPVEENKIITAGYEKKTALLGGVYYIKLFSRAGIGKYQNANILSPKANGGCTFSVLLSELTVPHIRPAVEQQMLSQGFERLAENGGLYKRTPRYQRDGLKVEFVLYNSGDSQTSNMIFRLFK